MEIEAKRERGVLLRAALILVLVFSFAVLVGVSYVQTKRVAGEGEVAGRKWAGLSGLLVVPALLFLAARIWTHAYRARLPYWRNGLALTSLVIASLVWILHWGTMLLSAFHLYLRVDSLLWFATLLYSNLLAGLLATALKGNSRVFVIGAVILTWAGMEAGIYF